MKNKIWKTAAAAAGLAICIFTGCSSEEKEDIPDIYLTADSGNSSVQLTLSHASLTSVSVSLGVGSAAESGKTAIEESRLTFDKTVVISAGQTSVTKTISVNKKGLSEGEYQAVITLVQASGANISGGTAYINVSVSGNNPEADLPAVSLSAIGNEFVENEATLVLTLSETAAEKITVTLAEAPVQNGKTAFPAGVLSFEKSAAIGIGETSATVKVTADPSALENGVEYQAAIAIAEAEGATFDQNAAVVYISLTKEFAAVYREDWSIQSFGKIEYEGRTYDAVGVYAPGTDYIDILYGPHGLAEYYGYDILTIMELRDQSLKEYLEENPDLTLEDALYPGQASDNDEYDVWYFPLEAGEYEFFVLGYTEDGSLTGEFTYNLSVIAEEEEASEAYNSWIGTYEVVQGDSTWTYEIVKFVNDVTFGMILPDYEYNEALRVPYDSETNTITIPSQEIDGFEDETEGYITVYYFGNYVDEETGEYAHNQFIPWTGYPIASGTLSGDGQTISLTGESVQVSEDEFLDIQGASLYGLPEDLSSGIYYSFTDDWLQFPATLRKVTETQPASAGRARTAAMSRFRTGRSADELRKKQHDFYSVYRRNALRAAAMKTAAR